jgi:predicted nucleic acid-binding protein
VTLLLLDTTLLIDRERGATELEGLIGDDDDVTIAAVTLAELTVGVELAGTRQRARRQSFVGDIAASIPILPYDERAAIRHASLLVAVRRAGRPSRRPRPDHRCDRRNHRARHCERAVRSAFDNLAGVTAIDHRAAHG